MDDRYSFLKAHGICVQCGQRDAFYGHVKCEKCIEKANTASAKCWDDQEKREKYNERARQRRKELYEQSKKERLCISCGRPTDNGVFCEWCKNKRNARRRTGKGSGGHFRERIADGACMYCGKEVLPGYKLCEEHLGIARERIKKIQHKASEKWRKEIEGEWREKKSKHSANG